MSSTMAPSVFTSARDIEFPAESLKDWAKMDPTLRRSLELRSMSADNELGVVPSRDKVLSKPAEIVSNNAFNAATLA